MNIATSAH